MDIDQVLRSFYERIAEDGRISSTHISLYTAMLYLYAGQPEVYPVQVKRSVLMFTAKISARQTYNKGMRELHDYGYINYIPSSNQFEVSLIYFVLNEELKKPFYSVSIP